MLPHYTLSECPVKLCLRARFAQFISTIMTSSDAIISAMRTTVALDDDLVRIAQEFTGMAKKPR